MNILSIVLYVMIALLWFMVPLPASSSVSLDSPESLLQNWLQPSSQTSISEKQPMVTDPSRLSRIARFYYQRSYQLAWFNRQGLIPQGEVLLRVLANAADEGLNPTAYQPQPWEPSIQFIGREGAMVPSEQLEEMVGLDISLTQSFLKYASDLQKGRTHPDAFTLSKGPELEIAPEILAKKLAAAVSEGRLEAFFDGLSPQRPEYQSLKRHLKRYEAIRDLGGWQKIPNGPSLKRGNQSPRIPMLSRHLLITGDLPLAHFSTQERYTEDLENAVKKYQYRNGITADGVVGPKTLAHLNSPVEERIAQIRLNMERWRWLPSDLGARHLMVNIPGFELKIVQDQTEFKTMRVIVGRKKRQTPIMSSLMTYLELNPYWNIPQTIAREDILPKVQSDPQYLTKNSIKVLTGWKQNAQMIDPTNIDWHGFSKRYLPYRLRQDPAPSNALGQVKFMFPNHHSIYIHDTPGKSLFKKETRNFSSGCVRVENPMELAHTLLKNQQWDAQRIHKAISSKKRQTIVMKHPIPVHLVYFTVWEEGNDLHFRQDIYDRDRRLMAALAPKPKTKLWCSNDTGSEIFDPSRSGLCQSIYGPQTESSI